MSRAPLALFASASVILMAGCGSSSSSSGGSTATATSTPTTESASTLPPSAKPSGPVQRGKVTITYQNIAISPASVNVKVGTLVRWVNQDSTPHNVTAQGTGPAHLMSKDFGQGGSYTFRVTHAGTVHYLCTIHPASMQGTINVVN